MAAIAAGLAWLAVLFKAPATWRRSSTPARRSLWVALLALAVGWTLRVPAGYSGLDKLTRVPNLAQLAGDGLALATAGAILGMLLYQTHDQAEANRRLRVRIALLAVVLVIMTVSFLASPVDREVNDFITHYGRERRLLPFSLAYLAYLSYAFTDLTRLCRRYARLADRPFLRMGMRLISAAGVLGLGYVVLRAAYLVAVQLGHGQHLSAYRPVSLLLVGTLSILAVVGAVLPALGPRVEAYRAYRKLHPLWQALHEATPGIAFTPRAGLGTVLSLRGLRFRLHRRVVEIRDGRLALRPYFRHEVASQARLQAERSDFSGEDLEAEVEAATLAAAVRDKAAGRPPRHEPVSAGSAGGGVDLDAETSWLRKVSRAYTRNRPSGRALQ